MSWYHVIIVQNSTSAEEVRLDYTLAELQQTVVDPYTSGRPLTVNGKTFAPNKIERVTITKTDLDSSHIRHTLPMNPRARPFVTTRGIDKYIAHSGEDMTDQFITGPPGSESKGQPSDTAEEISQSRTIDSIRIFISHSSHDIALAKILIELLEKALHPRSREIRCTSVDGYRMQSGAPTDQRLRAEVHDADLLIGIITPNSMKSAYVIFELGARWGAEKPMIPLLASGATPELLEGPLAGINAMDARYESQVYQLVEDAGDYLSIELDKTSSYASAVSALVQLSKETEVIVEQSPAVDRASNLSDDAKELLIEAADDQFRGIHKARTMGGLTIHTNGKDFGEMGDKRSEARWEQALRELVGHELVTDPRGKDQYFEVTHNGFEIVDHVRGA